MKTKYTLANHIQQLNFFARALGECIEDVSESRNGIPIYPENLS